MRDYFLGKKLKLPVKITLLNIVKTINLFAIVRNPNYIYRAIVQNFNTYIMEKSVFYHAGCPVCLSAEHDIINLVGASNVDVVHLGQDKSKIAQAEHAGVKSVPALVTPNGHVLHINYGASMADVKG